MTTSAERFSEEHPAIYRAIVDASLVLLAEARERGSSRIGMKAVFEALRWRGEFKRQDGEPWLLNNTLTAGMARLVMEREPALHDAFETRRAAKDNDEPSVPSADQLALFLA